jgi:hypothetical protein
MQASFSGTEVLTQEIDGGFRAQVARDLDVPFIATDSLERMLSISAKVVTAKTCLVAGQTCNVGVMWYTTGTRVADGLALPDMITLLCVGQAA